MRCEETSNSFTDAPCHHDASYSFALVPVNGSPVPALKLKEHVCENHARLYEQLMHRHFPGAQFTLTMLTEQGDSTNA